MWYAAANMNRIGRMDQKFQETTFVPVTGSTGGLSGLAFDDAGNVWFSKSGGKVVGKFPAAGGEGVEYELPEEANYPVGLVRGPDGAMWYYDPVHQNLGRVGADGSTTVIPPPPKLNPFGPNGMTAGIDNSLWLTDIAQNALWKLDIATLKYKRHDIPDARVHPKQIRVAQDGTVWFTMTATNKLGRMAPNGVFTTIPTDGPSRGVHIADDASVWYVDNAGNLVRLKPDGTSDRYQCQGSYGGLATAADGSVWSIGNNDLKVLRLSTTNAPRIASTATVAPPLQQDVKGQVPNITLAELRKLFDDKTRKVVVHYTVWENKGCGYCDGSFAIFDEFARRNAGKATFVRVAAEYGDSVWRDPWLAKNATLKGFPTFITYYDQAEVARVNGRMSANVLNARLLPAL
jgi:virginiamycin B lyase